MNWSSTFAIGDVVEVSAKADRSTLPSGLSPGFQVRLIRSSPEVLIVEREGREWTLQQSLLRPRLGVGKTMRR